MATDDMGVGRRVFVRGKRRDMTTLANGLAELGARGIRPRADAVFVEVGANMGTTTVMALRRHGFATAVALEPSPQNVWLCRLNLVANGLDERVTLLPYAASNRAEEMDLVIGGGNRGGHRVMSAGSDHPGRRAASVASRSTASSKTARSIRLGSGCSGATRLATTPTRCSAGRASSRPGCR